MLGRLMRQFAKSGLRDHLAARRAREEADLHRLFVLTTFQRTEGDGLELVRTIAERGEALQYEELKAEVTANLTHQVLAMCAAVRDAVSSHTAKVGGRAHRVRAGCYFLGHHECSPSYKYERALNPR